MIENKLGDIEREQFNQGRLCDTGVFPKVINIDTVSFCNLRCSMCMHRKMERKKGIMSWDVFTKIIDEIAEVDKDIRVWMVFSGEALLLKRRKPSIFDMLVYAKTKGLTDVVLNTNANLMDEKTACNLIKSGLDAIYISIDAFSPTTYAMVRIGGDYKMVVENTLNLLELKKRSNLSKPEVFVQFIEMEANKLEKEDFIDFWKEKGATVKIRPKISWAGSVDAPNLVLGDKGRWPCYWAMQVMSIIHTGEVVTCAADLDAKFIAGDVNKNSLKQIWNTTLKELRMYQVSKRFDQLPDNCKNCKDWQSARADYYS